MDNIVSYSIFSRSDPIDCDKKINLVDKTSCIEERRITDEKFKSEIHPYHYTGPCFKTVKPQKKKRFRCPFDTCKRMFSHEVFFISHLSSHDNNDLQCKYCYKVYRDRNQLMDHEAIHRSADGELKYFLCTVEDCGHKCLSSDLLQLHEKLEHSKMYQCKLCLKTFTVKGRYLQHRQTHKTLRPHSCADCGMCFKTSSQRNDHAKIHNNKKAHTCQLCGWEFRRFGNLKRHLQVHRGKNCFCKFCFANFSHHASLSKHIKTYHASANRNSTDASKLDKTRKKSVNLQISILEKNTSRNS